MSVSSPPPIGGLRVLYTAEEVAASTDDYGLRTVWSRCQRRTLPHVPISPGRIGILDGDDQVIHGGAADGPAVLRAALRGVDHLGLAAMAWLLRVSTRTLQRLIEKGELPAVKRAGCWGMSGDEFVGWLLARRVPARWEVE